MASHNKPLLFECCQYCYTTSSSTSKHGYAVSRKGLPGLPGARRDRQEVLLPEEVVVRWNDSSLSLVAIEALMITKRQKLISLMLQAILCCHFYVVKECDVTSMLSVDKEKL